MRNPIFYSIEKNIRLHKPYQTDSFCSDIDYCNEVFCNTLKEYGTLYANINKNSNASGLIQQGFKAYTISRNLINNEVYNKVCKNFEDSFENGTPQTRERVCNVMRLFNFIQNDKYIIIT